MARQSQLKELNRFTKGLITEASPLTFPEDASLDEDNFIIQKDGSRRRRLGMDLEVGAQTIDLGVSVPTSGELAPSSFRWRNAGGILNQDFIVVQVAGSLTIYSLVGATLSTHQVYSTTMDVDESRGISYAAIDGDLVLATGAQELTRITYDGTTFTKDNYRLKVRDVFGVEDITTGNRDLNSSNEISYRPNTLSAQHHYNLRNQGFGRSVVTLGDGQNSETLFDPIERFYLYGDGDKKNVYPSNADNINYALFPNTLDSQDPTGDRFWVDILAKNPVGNFPMAKGSFIIDALNRGDDRKEALNSMKEKYPSLKYTSTGLSKDQSPDGASCVAEYAGRVWYGGFTSTVTSPDSRSPKLASYILYSQLVKHFSDLGECYQSGDPTTKDFSDIVDTDGGFIRLDGAFGVKKMVVLDRSLIVLAENGVWAVSGADRGMFSANSQQVAKLTEEGPHSPHSIVVSGDSIWYWADTGIYRVGIGESGDLEANNMTKNTIQREYDNINERDKFYAQGHYDKQDNTITWLYGQRVGSTTAAKELVVDLDLQAFFPKTLSTLDTHPYVKPLCLVEVPPYKAGTQELSVIDGTTDVYVGSERVVYTDGITVGGTRDLKYVVLLDAANTVQITFGQYRDLEFKDWKSVDGVGVDAPAYVLTGYMGGEDYQRNKQLTYVNFHFRRTETGFYEDVSGDLWPLNESSCKFQAQWNWTDSIAAGRWTKETQVYRYKRSYFAEDAADDYDTGDAVLTTKNKVRGKGKVVSFLLKTEPEKDLNLLGWSMAMTTAGNL